MSHARTIWISPRTLAFLAILVLAALGGFAAYSAATNDRALVEPAQRVAAGFATLDLYAHPVQYKNELTWRSYQQVLALQSQYGKELLDASVARLGSAVVLDRDLFAKDTANVLAQVFVKDKQGQITLTEFQFQVVREDKAWRVNDIVSALVKGKVAEK